MRRVNTMADDEIPEIAVDVSYGDEKKSSGGSSGRSTKSIEDVPEGSFDWLVAALRQHNTDIDIPFFEEDATRELTDAEIEGFGLEEGTNFSIESLFGISSEREYVGDPLVRKEWFDSEEEAEEYAESNDISSSQVRVNADDEHYVAVNLTDEVGDEKVDRHAKIELGYALNGYHAEDIVEEFGDDVYLRVSVGADLDKYDGPQERAKNLRIKTTETDNAEKKRRSAIENCSNASLEDEESDEDEEE